jgi:membrane protein DedA with SNARE-associated domain
MAGPRARWGALTARRKWQAVLGAVAALVAVVLAVQFMADRDGISVVDGGHPGLSYLAVFALVVLDAVVPIFPGETTLNAASTAAAKDVLDLAPVIVAGALGAIVGDSALFWLARRFSRRIRPHVDKARANRQVAQALAIMDSSASVLIVGGRYVPGMRFVVNATMGLSDMPFRRFFAWSALSGALWSVYTCVLAYQIGRALGDFPLASVFISGTITTLAIAMVLLTVRRHRQSALGSDGQIREQP